MKRLYIPWSLPGTFNGNHPLVTSLVDNGNGCGAEFLQPRTSIDQDDIFRTLREFTGFTARMMDYFAGHPVVTAEHVIEFVQSRDALAQHVRPLQADLIFLHTVPNTTDAMPWILHIEMLVNMFIPFAWQGRTGGMKLRSLPAYWLVRYMLEQPQCKAIFSHLKQTAVTLGTLFQSPIIEAKSHHIPLGVAVTPEQETAIDRAIAARSSDDVTVLFTNSFYQWPDNFVLRGGVDVVTAFIAASKHAGNLRLVLLTSLPDTLGPKLRELIATHPRIQHISERISEDELFRLYCGAQIFVVPAAALHALSVARAMYSGNVCIASDAPGYEEYITNSVTGFLLPGRREAVYSAEEETGWLRDDYGPMFKPNSEYSANLATLLIRLARSEPLRRQVSQNARVWAKQNLSQLRWVEGFTMLLRNLPA